MLEIKFKKLVPDAILPQSQTPGSVGYDLHAHLLSETGRPIKQLIPPNSTRNVRTGLNIELPPGYFAMVCSRSGIAKRSIFVTNGPGIIDPDYRGEVMVLLYNGSHESHWVQHQERIAQLVIMPVTYATMIEVDELSLTERGEAGFGSTGS